MFYSYGVFDSEEKKIITNKKSKPQVCVCFGIVPILTGRRVELEMYRAFYIYYLITRTTVYRYMTLYSNFVRFLRISVTFHQFEEISFIQLYNDNVFVLYIFLEILLETLSTTKLKILKVSSINDFRWVQMKSLPFSWRGERSKFGIGHGLL